MARLGQNLTDICITALEDGYESRSFVCARAKVLAKKQHMHVCSTLTSDNKQPKRADQMCTSHEDSDSERTASMCAAAWVCKHAAQHQMLTTINC